MLVAVALTRRSATRTVHIHVRMQPRSCASAHHDTRDAAEILYTPKTNRLPFGHDVQDMIGIFAKLLLLYANGSAEIWCFFDKP